MKLRTTLAVLAVLSAPLLANSFASTISPYTGQKQKIKALSRQEMADYLEGKGMGFAKAAELNHYPGPRHVLDLANELALSKEQITESQAVYDVMKKSAVNLGKRLVQKELELDGRFAAGSIDPASLKALLEEIGKIQAEIRYTHLHAHLQQRALLSQHQIRLYDQLRGYGQDRHQGEHRHSH